MPTKSTLRSKYDAVIVGARAAGAATALLLARRGLRVLAVERSRYGSDTLSTLALMRAGVLQLHRWGVLDALVKSGAAPIRTTTFHYGDEDAIRIDIKPTDGIDALYAPRRTILDSLLVDAAREAGAEVLHGARAVGLLHADDGRVRGLEIEHEDHRRSVIDADIVIGADGQNSTVARLTDAATYRSGRHSGGVIYGYWDGLDNDGYQWHYNTDSGAGAIPTHDGLTLVFSSFPSERFGAVTERGLDAGFYETLAACAPKLAESVTETQRVGRFWGFPGRPGYIRQSWGPGWALVGDAGYFKDPITAHGISDALRDAELLAQAVARGDDGALAAYQEERDELSGLFFETTDQIAAYDWDLEQVKALHLTASREMKREVEWLRTLERRHPNTKHRAA